MDLAAVLAAPAGSAPLDGLPDAWHWALAPGFDFAAALSADRGHILQCYALDSYDEGLVRAVLAFAREHAAELIVPVDRPLALVEGFTHPGALFDTVATVAPGVHKYHQDNPPVHAVTRAVFPAYRCEFAGDETLEEAQYLYGRATGVPVTRLKREPRPFIKMRYRTDSGREIRERGFAALTTFVHLVRALEDNAAGFVEFEDYLRRVRRVEWDGAWALLDGAADRRGLDVEELLDLVKAELYGPDLAAGDSEFTKEL